MVRWTVARALGTMGKLPPEHQQSAVAGLARLLADSDLNLRMAAAFSLEATSGTTATRVSVGWVSLRTPTTTAMQISPRNPSLCQTLNYGIRVDYLKYLLCTRSMTGGAW